MLGQPLSCLGWKSFFEQQICESDLSGAFLARVSAHFGSEILIAREIDELRIPGQLVASVGIVVVGDWLLLEENTNRAIKRLERQTLLSRKASGEEIKSQGIAANVDTIFIVSSCNEDLNFSRIERYLALTIQSGALPVVVLTKSDLSEDPGGLRRKVERLQSGLLVECVDARAPAQTDVLKGWCGPGQSVALVGSSGVGKSTLANSLGALNLATGGIREKDGKGRHTTTARSLHKLPSGGVLIDNPGIRELQLPGCEEGVLDVFQDITELADKCRFRDCTHQQDSGCAVVQAIEAGELELRRYQSYLKLLSEQRRNSKSLAQRREAERAQGRFYKSVIQEKRRQRADD